MMIETVKKEIGAKVVFVLFLVFTIWWAGLRLTNQPGGSDPDQLFAAIYGILALWGGIWGIIISKKWGFLSSVMGKSIFFFSLGLFFQETGQILYSYFIYFKHIQDPYPSLGDVFFYGTIPLYIVAIVYLGLASGVHLSLKSLTNKIQAIVIPLIVLSVCYFFFLQQYQFDWSNPLKVIIDFGAPLGQAIYISLAILIYTLTKGLLGGVMKSRVLLVLFALFIQFVADWTFLYEASRNLWYAGELNDYQYMCAYVLMAIALLSLDTAYKELNESP